jgi:hypothetical protein
VRAYAVPEIIVEGLDELERRFSQSPQKLQYAIDETMAAAIYALWEKVPPYPNRNQTIALHNLTAEMTGGTARQFSGYIRTGLLGRSLGSSMRGGVGNNMPDIFDVAGQGKMTVGEFGTRTNYAPYVIGEKTQARVHAGIWWTLESIIPKALPKIQRLFRVMTEELAAWLDHGK